MKVPAIKKLVELYSVSQLETAEEILSEEMKPEIEVEGDDLGEKLTHVYAAIWVKKYMEAENQQFAPSLREFTKKVRESIS